MPMATAHAIGTATMVPMKASAEYAPTSASRRVTRYVGIRPSAIRQMRSVFHSANARRLGQLQGWIPRELQGRLMAHHPNHEEYMNQRQAAHASVSPCAKLEGGSWRRLRWRRDPSRCGTGAHCVTRASQSSVCMPAMPISSAVYRAVCGHHLAVGKINSRCLCHTLRSSAFTREYARLTGFAQKVSGLEEPYPREG